MPDAAAPAPGAAEPFAFAIASCQRWDDGHYAAWRHLADESPDVVVFLGDYIYECGAATIGENFVVGTHGTDEATTLEAYRNRYARYKADADIHGVLIAEMAPLGREVICGSVNDATFGPTVMFGLGGIFVEVLKDVTFRVAPFSPACAQTMFPEIKAYPLLQGVRGEKRLDQEQLANTVSRISQLVTDLSDEIAETDANPLMLYEEGRGLKVVDARIILKKKK